MIYDYIVRVRDTGSSNDDTAYLYVRLVLSSCGKYFISQKILDQLCVLLYVLKYNRIEHLY